jgi:c-di-GMP-binding flagellar brake protein YcgR
MATFDEKRRFPRVVLKTPLFLKIRGTQKFDNTLSEDISEGGLCCTSDAFIPPKTNLMLEFNVLAKTFSPIGRVAWANSLPHTNKYKLGIEFISMDMESRRYLNNYIGLRLGTL